MAPEMEYVDSSNIESVGYDGDTRELHVSFVTGKLYIYAEVPEETYAELLSADSKGSYLNREIKPNYECRET